MESNFLVFVIFSGVFGLIIVIILPETGRAVVGNGSVLTAKWNRSGWQLLRQNCFPSKKVVEPNYSTIQKGRRRPNPLASLMIVTKKEESVILIYGSLLYSSYMAVLSTLTT